MVARLYTQFRPDNYELEISPDRESMTFEGKAIILGKKVGPPSSRITLHQKGLKIKKAVITKLDKKGEQKLTLDRINSQRSFDELRLHTKEKVFPGQYRVEIEFSGKITDQMHGVYPCYYEKRQKTLIATQFESHHAREVFPCVDEPEAKATFDLILLTPKSETVLANTPASKQVVKGSKHITTFETTPIMSTYLLAFVYGDMVYKEDQTKNGISVRSYSVPENKNLIGFSAEVAVKCIEFFEDYFGVPYPLKKLDLVALPDFSVGAMENWGLMTFRDTVMLADPKKTSIETKQLVALVVAHEVSHQWFGNLVTMKWWDDLWLNESFANLMEYRAVDQIFPEWKIWEQFVNHEVSAALRRDALPNVQAIRTPLRHPDELESLFDPAIAYAKGGSVLNMLRNHIGEPSFREGLSSYFKKHAYGNTEAHDLWQSFSDASGENIGEFMDNWLNKPGFPEVVVDYKPGSKDLNLTQKRLVVGDENKHATNTVWKIPLAPSVEVLDRVLTSKGTETNLKDKPGDLLLLNDEGKSYFVPHYINQGHFEEILENIKQGKLSAINRLLLLQQNALLEQAQLVKTIDNLKLIEAYPKESEEAVWGAITTVANSPRRLVSGDEESEAHMRHFMANLVSPLVKKIGWKTTPSEGAQTLRLRSLVLTVAASAEIPEVITEAKKRFKTFKNPSDLEPEIREAVYFVAAKFGSDEDFEKLLKTYIEIENSDERGEIASGLCSVKSPERIARLLELIKTDSVRKNVVVSWYVYLLSNRYARAQTWQWLKDNWKWVEEHFGSEKNYDSFPRYSANVFSTSQELKEYKDFFRPKMKEVGLERTILIGLEEIKARVGWRKSNESEVKKWLAKNYSTSIRSSTE